jgi:putative transport protein
MDPKILSIIREIGLVFFLCIVGLKYGFRALDSIMGSGLLLAVSAVVIGNIAMLVGFLVGRYIFKLNWVMLAGAICGGMTSTPGLGAAIDTLDSDDPAAGYGATYPFALLGMIIFTILLNKLPLV